MREDKKQRMINNARDEFIFKKYAENVFKNIFPGTHKSMEDDHDFETVILYDTGLLLVETDKDEFEKELSSEESIEIINFLLKRLMFESDQNNEMNNERDNKEEGDNDSDLMFR